MSQARWEFVVGPPAPTGGHTDVLEQCTTRTVTWRLEDQHEASVTLDDRSGSTSNIVQLASDLHILRNGSELFRGRIGPASDDIGAASHTATFTALSYRGVLARRRLFASDLLSWSSAYPDDIMWGLISQTQARTGGNLAITKGAGFGWHSGVSTTSLAGTPGDAIADKINDLSNLQSTMFDWDITPYGAVTLCAEIWMNSRGASSGVILEHGGSLTSSPWKRESDPSTYANAIRVTGDQGASPIPTPVEAVASDITTRPEGRWDQIYGTALQTSAEVSGYAPWQLQQAQAVIPTYTIPLRNGAWGGPTHIWLGDTVEVQIKSGRLLTDAPLRVYEITATANLDGSESVQLTVGGPKPNIKKQLALILRRLRDLERR